MTNKRVWLAFLLIVVLISACEPPEGNSPTQVVVATATEAPAPVADNQRLLAVQEYVPDPNGVYASGPVLPDRCTRDEDEGLIDIFTDWFNRTFISGECS